MAKPLATPKETNYIDCLRQSVFFDFRFPDETDKKPTERTAVPSPCQFIIIIIIIITIITGLPNGVFNSTNYAASNYVTICEQRTEKDTEVVVARF